MPAAEIIQATEAADELETALREIEAAQWRLVAIRNRIEAAEDINLHRVNRAATHAARAIERLTDASAALIVGISTAKGDSAY